MGFFDSLGAGLGSVATGLGTGLGNILGSLGTSFSNDPFGTTGGIIQIANAFGANIGGGPTSGSPGGTVPQFAPFPGQRNTITVRPGGGNVQFDPRTGQIINPGNLIESRSSAGWFIRDPDPATLPGFPVPISSGPARPFSFGTGEFGTGFTQVGFRAGELEGLRERSQLDPRFPGGAFVPSFPVTQNTGFQMAGLPMLPQIGQGIANFLTGGSGCNTSPFRPTCNGGSASPQVFMAPNPATGKATWFRPAGNPILWSGDLQATKRVARAARRARRSRPR